MSIGHEGLGDRYRQLRLIAARCDSISRKTSNKSRNWTFDIGLWTIIFFILIKAAATIRNFKVIYARVDISLHIIIVIHLMFGFEEHHNR